MLASIGNRDNIRNLVACSMLLPSLTSSSRNSQARLFSSLVLTSRNYCSARFVKITSRTQTNQAAGCLLSSSSFELYGMLYFPSFFDRRKKKVYKWAMFPGVWQFFFSTEGASQRPPILIDLKLTIQSASCFLTTTKTSLPQPTRQTKLQDHLNYNRINRK